MTRAFAGLMIILVLMLGVYYLSLITPTIVPPPPDTPTPTPIIALPPTPTPPPLLPTPTSTTTPAPTVVTQPETFTEEATPTPPAAPTPSLSVGSAPNCPNPAAKITQPGDGATVIGLVQIQGSAAIDNFEYYKFEFQDPGSGEWVFVSRFDNPVAGGVLGAWNSDTVPPGVYQFRLVVVDKTGNFPEPCQVTFQVQ